LTNAESVRSSFSRAAARIGFQRMNEPPPVALVGVITGYNTPSRACTRVTNSEKSLPD
jgi:hypothetical protein